jgi:hypothetical protein
VDIFKDMKSQVQPSQDNRDPSLRRVQPWLATSVMEKGTSSTNALNLSRRWTRAQRKNWSSLVEKLLSGGGIKVTKGAWQVPKWLAFVPSQVVLLGETWWPGSNTLVWVLQQCGLGVA